MKLYSGTEKAGEKKKKKSQWTDIRQNIKYGPDIRLSLLQQLLASGQSVLKVFYA